MAHSEGPTSESADTSVSATDEADNISSSSQLPMDSTSTGMADSFFQEETSLSNSVLITTPGILPGGEERPRSPSVFSEGTKPDPPSILGGHEDVSDTLPRGREDPQNSRNVHNDGSQSSDSENQTTPPNIMEKDSDSSDDDPVPDGAKPDSTCSPPLSTIDTSGISVDHLEDDEHDDHDVNNESIAKEQETLTAPSLSGNTNIGSMVYDAPHGHGGDPYQNMYVMGGSHPSEKGHGSPEHVTTRMEDGAVSVHSRMSMVSTHGMPPPMPSGYGYAMAAPPGMMMVTAQAPAVSGGKRKIRLRLEQEVPPIKKRSGRASFLGHFRSRSKRMFGSESTLSAIDEIENSLVSRGSISVSWYEGTSGIELHEHVRQCVVRKLQLPRETQLHDMRLMDDTLSPPEEIVLSPYIPDGSHFLLQFRIRDSNDGTSTPGSSYSMNRAPVSPSAAPSPHPRTELAGLSAKQLDQLRIQLNALRGSERTPVDSQGRKKYTPRDRQGDTPLPAATHRKTVQPPSPSPPPPPPLPPPYASTEEVASGEEKKELDDDEELTDGDEDDDDDMMFPDDPIAAQLQQITKLLVEDRQKSRHNRRSGRGEKRQVIFVLANYFVVFLAVIAVSAEIQARLPDWLASMETQMKNVQDCAANQEALFQCVSNGDVAGLIASVLVWLSRSVVTKRIFLLGFDTPKKLWTVVYESLVTAVCWGFSYMFIRRGMNPDTRRRFIQKYWKDAVYGSLAGFNAAFMKQILKNLIPQEAVEDALRERQLKILSWIPSFA